MKCPACPETNLVMSERQGIEIDYCPSCRGVWLDRGELDKIIERSVQQEAPAPPRHQPSYQPPPPQQQYGHYPDKDHYKKSHGYHYKKKKSFFEELFD
ncbi:MAG: hypothetical protein FIA89_15800 [Geobacter sp.]|nr:hypothetical protein [Geobacter sp.]